MRVTINNNEERNEVLMYVSDLFKDVNGFRPRGYDFSAFSDEYLADFVNDLCEELGEQIKEEEKYRNNSIARVMECGCDKETACKWLDDADLHYMYDDDDRYSYDIERFGWASRYQEKLERK